MRQKERQVMYDESSQEEKKKKSSVTHLLCSEDAEDEEEGETAVTVRGSQIKGETVEEGVSLDGEVDDIQGD